MAASNVFFQMALNKASKWLGKPGRLVKLVVDLSGKLRRVNWSEVKGADVKSKFFILGRMIKAYATGSYRDIPWKSLLLIAAAIIYFINPIDLIPDWIPGLGITDDVGILLYVYNNVLGDVDRFLLWEKENNISLESI